LRRKPEKERKKGHLKGHLNTYRKRMLMPDQTRTRIERDRKAPSISLSRPSLRRGGREIGAKKGGREENFLEPICRLKISKPTYSEIIRSRRNLPPLTRRKQTLT